MPVDALPDAALTALREGALDAVLLFSGRSSETFAKGVVTAGLQGACASLVAIAISEAAASSLSATKFRELRISARPNQDAMLALLR